MKVSLVLLLLLLLGFATYSRTFQGGFYFDDRTAIVRNEAIRHGIDFRTIWNAFNTRFIAGVTFALNYAMGKLNPLGYRLFNVTCHIFSSFLVYLFVLFTFETPLMKESSLKKHAFLLSLFSSLVFLVHPIQTQGVNFIWQRVSSLATFFYLASLVLYIRARLASRLSAYVGALLTTVAGMFCKEIAVTIPFMMILYEFSFLGSWKERTQERVLYLFPFLLSLAVIPVTLAFASGSVAMKIMQPASGNETLKAMILNMTRGYPSGGHPRRTYLLTQANVLRTYLRLLFFPIRQNLDYDYPIARTLAEPQTLFSIFLLLAILIVTVKLFQKHRILAFGICWFFVTLSMESLIVLQDVIFEHRLYLPMVGFSLFLPAALLTVLRDRKKFVALSSIIIFIFSIAAYRRNEVWKNEVSLWEDTVRKSPNKARPLNNLGVAYGKKGRYDEEIEYCLRAIQLNPTDARTYNNVGFAYGKKGRYDKEVEYLQKTIFLDPQYADAYYNLGVVYGEEGLYQSAIECFEKAIQLDPQYADAYTNLGVIYGKRGEMDKEVVYYFKAIARDPDNAYAYNNLGVAFGEKGDSQKALDYFKKAVALDPTYSEARANLAKIQKEE